MASYSISCCIIPRPSTTCAQQLFHADQYKQMTVRLLAVNTLYYSPAIGNN